jgi:hypothetical protein
MISPPSKATLRKYGWSDERWLLQYRIQDGCCAVCKQVPRSGRLVIDHEHVKGWKAMRPERRAKYVRGLTCWWCNHAYLGRGITVEKARGVLAYLLAYEERK